MNRILQVVPRRPPPAEPLFQVATRLVAEFRRPGGLQVDTVAAADGWTDLFDRAGELSAGDALLVHYVGYGYARRGAPLRFSRALQRWRHAVRGRILLVHFHEVAAFGPPWRSSFWLRPLQILAARRLDRAATRSMTSLDRFAADLRRDEIGTPLQILPIFSPIGEPSDVVPLCQRAPRLVLFGSPAARAQIWAEARAELEAAVNSLGVTSIVEIGSQPVGPDAVFRARVSRVGELSDADTSRILSESLGAFFDYPVEYLSKSSAFAAACAHAVLPVCRARRQHSRPAEGEGERWVAAHELESSDTELRQRIASAARTWYSGHSVRRHAAFWMGAFSG